MALKALPAGHQPAGDPSLTETLWRSPCSAPPLPAHRQPAGSRALLPGMPGSGSFRHMAEKWEELWAAQEDQEPFGVAWRVSSVLLF